MMAIPYLSRFLMSPFRILLWQNLADKIRSLFVYTNLGRLISACPVLTASLDV
jgi:hypothetical protein